MVKILHFADAHIDIANYGRHDPDTALPVRVMDFLRSLDQIVATAISEQVDLVIFAGDAYKDRNPQPTFQRAWGERMMRLSEAGIPTLLLVGNHDVAPATGRAHTVQEFKTLAVPHIHVADAIDTLGPEDLDVPVQIITVPWVSRSGILTREDMAGKSQGEVLEIIESRVAEAIQGLIEEADPELPLILTAHASVQGASYGSEKAVMLGHELVLSGTIVNDQRLDYVALGHIHKHQSLNGGRHPPIIYPGSIERIDFGEVRETKGFVMAEVGRGHADWAFQPLETRPYIDLEIKTTAAETFMEDVMRQLPEPEEVEGAVCRIQLTYPRDWEIFVDETAIGDRFKSALSFQILKHRLSANRTRLADVTSLESLSPLELLAEYWKSEKVDLDEAQALQALAQGILADLEE